MAGKNSITLLTGIIAIFMLFSAFTATPVFAIDCQAEVSELISEPVSEPKPDNSPEPEGESPDSEDYYDYHVMHINLLRIPAFSISCKYQFSIPETMFPVLLPPPRV